MSRRKQEEPEDPFAGLKGAGSNHEIGDASAWTGVGVDELLAVVCAVTGRGDALLIGTTTDGGAMSLMIMSRGAKRRFYESDADAMNETLREIIRWAENS